LTDKQWLMRFAVIATVVTAAFSSIGATHAAELVRFKSAGTPPTPFQIMRAKAKGEVAKAKPGDEITGTLRLPDGKGPFPAIVLSHGCRGVLPFIQDWAEYISENGAATLVVNSFTTRGLDDECNNIHGSRDQSSDAYGALEYLAGQENIDPNRLGLIGWGQSPVTGMMEEGGIERFFPIKFQAAVGLYVDCGYFTEGKVYAPTLLIIAGKDDWVKQGRCANSVDAGRSVGSPISKIEYPDTRHSFDDPATGNELQLDVQNPYRNPPMGATLGYDAGAHKDARQQVWRFLAGHLAIR